ncbi:MAG: Kdo2-lipid lauroyltransferase/acyltransferase [Chthoniobacter sp.]|jgi:lauroyl/myristoyl acyltransferase|nr:Kdo2-lipid lauroyltransferase/acyltransferase [Chthoniobacter sp.]
MNASLWKRTRYRIEWLLCEALAHFVPLWPRWLCTAAAHLLGSVGFRFDQRGRIVAVANLEAAFGTRYTPKQREQIARDSYRNFARTMIDLFWSPRLSAQNFSKQIALEGVEVLQKLKEEARGAVLMCVHQGNFEWTSLACGFHGFPTMIVAEDFKNPLLAPIFRRLRQTSAHQIIEQDRSMIRLLKHVKRGGFAGMLIDLNVRPEQAAVIIETFGLQTCVTMLHAVLAQRGHAALVPLDSRPFPDGSCRAILHPPIEVPEGATLAEISQICWNYFEPWVRESPESWMWAYKHWRYKPREAQREYPFYANESSKFEKLLRTQMAT